mmetsp:Transcript_42738/g.54919  ORF Transcript_42738/g.54919 Transcript_42738/m.54919 type:complete len:107 (+) Transcript_42738:352-672(+)
MLEGQSFHHKGRQRTDNQVTLSLGLGVVQIFPHIPSRSMSSSSSNALLETDLELLFSWVRVKVGSNDGMKTSADILNLFPLTSSIILSSTSLALMCVSFSSYGKEY